MKKTQTFERVGFSTPPPPPHHISLLICVQMFDTSVFAVLSFTLYLDIQHFSTGLKVYIQEKRFTLYSHIVNDKSISFYSYTCEFSLSSLFKISLVLFAIQRGVLDNI
jgi:hypothetical protein